MLLEVVVGGAVEPEEDLAGLAAADALVVGQGAVEDVVGQAAAGEGRNES